MGELNKQVSTLAEEKRQLEAKVTTFEQENAARQVQPEVTTPATEEMQKLNVGTLPLILYDHSQLIFFFICRTLYAQNVTSYLQRKKTGLKRLRQPLRRLLRHRIGNLRRWN